MNNLARDHGLGVALALGIVLLLIGVVWQRPDALLAGIIFGVIGAAGRPLQEFVMGRSGVSLKWQRETAREIRRRVEDRLVLSDTADSAVIRETGDVIVHPPTARGTGDAHDATVKTSSITMDAVIVRPQSPEEFAETVVESIAPIIIRPETARLELHGYPPDVRIEPVPDERRKENL